MSDLQDRLILLQAEADADMEEDPTQPREARVASAKERLEEIEQLRRQLNQVQHNNFPQDSASLAQAAIVPSTEELGLPDDVVSALALVETDDESTTLLREQFEASQHALRAMVSTYDTTLKSKLHAVKQISEERARFEAMKASYETKMAELDAEVRETTLQRNTLEEKLKEIESFASQTEVCFGYPPVFLL